MTWLSIINGEQYFKYKKFLRVFACISQISVHLVERDVIAIARPETRRQAQHVKLITAALLSTSKLV